MARKKSSKRKVKQRHIFLALLIFIILVLFLNTGVDYLLSNKITSNSEPTITQAPVITDTPTPTNIPTISPSPFPPTPTQGAKTIPSVSDSNWGTSEQIGADKWRLKVGHDDRMATPNEIFEALNNYRQVHGVGRLNWNENLASFAQLRANSKVTDHQGFTDFLKNQDGHQKLGFGTLGENLAYCAGPTLGVHVIEWLFAGDKPHNDNQLRAEWDHVGIGVNGYYVDIVFGANKF